MAKKIELEELLEFINYYYSDDHLYTLAPHLYEDKIFEVFWTRYASEPKWTIRQKGAKGVYPVHSEDIIKFCNDNKINLLELHLKLMDKALVNTANLMMIIDKANEVFGEDLVERAYQDVQDFYKNLQATVDKMVGDQKNEDSKVIKLLKNNDEE